MSEKLVLQIVCGHSKILEIVKFMFSYFEFFFSLCFPVKNEIKH